MNMTKEKYRAERQRRGTMMRVAELLGVHWTTISRRERGVVGITREVAAGMAGLPVPESPERTPGKKDSK